MRKQTIGGVNEKLVFYKTSDVIFEEGSNKVESFIEGAIPFVLRCVLDTVSYETSEQDVDNEKYFASIINGVLSDVNPINKILCDKIQWNKCICLAELKTGKKLQLGSLFTPISLAVNPKVSERHSFNGNLITVTANSAQSPDFL